ncbi:MAG: hypothetical protein ACYSUY_08105 [Planctomycetota bacterium]|jgi:hypothetical protein
MKQLVVFSGFAVLMFGLCGCQNANSGIDVIIEGGGEFPEFLVGEWKSDKDGWEFVFEPDGTLSSAVVSLGRVRLKPGEVTTVKMKMDGEGIYEPGEWIVHYIPAGRELMVRITLKKLYLELGESVLEGKSADVFAGTIAQNGKVWQVEWTSFPDYVAHTDKHPNFPISDETSYGFSKTLIFEKATEE